MRAITVTAGPLAAASANNIATSQSAGAAGPVTINGSTASGGVATLDNPRRVLITSAGNDSGITFTISGTNWSGSTISETVTGANAGTVASVLDYKTVTGIRTSGATASTITVGTNGIGTSPWARLDEYNLPQTSIQVNASGTVNYTVQSSLDDPNDITSPVYNQPNLMTWINSGDPNVVAATGSVQSNFGYVPRWVRIVLNSGTGSATMTIYQAGGLRS